MTTRRAHIGLKTKLCSALCQMLREVDGKLEPIIPYDLAKQMTEDEVLAIFDWHHNVPKAHDGPDTHWNIAPMEKAPHRKRTAEIDVPTIAKSKRIVKAHDAHQKIMAAKVTGIEPEPGRRARSWPSRPLHGRGFRRQPSP